MPKIKSHSGAKKRFKVTKSGKVKYKAQGQRHLLAGDSGNYGRKMRRSRILGKMSTKVIKALLPYA
jgi:large subunit ribosomal protein L35